MKPVNCRQDEAGKWWYYFPDGRRITLKTLACAYCGKEFLHYEQFRKFCSQRCCAQSRGASPVTKTCPTCKREFAGKEAAQVYCSHKCAALMMHAKRPVTTMGVASDIIGADNPRYSQDEQGQWWYYPGGAKRHARTRAYIKTCKTCQRQFVINIVHRKSQEYCSRGCAPHAGSPGVVVHKGKSAANWKGGRHTTARGYVEIWAPHHPSRKGKRPYVLEHRLVMESMIGRFLETNEYVHHKNGIRDDNRPENLELWVDRTHPHGQRAWERQHCPSCTCFQQKSEDTRP